MIENFLQHQRIRLAPTFIGSAGDIEEIAPAMPRQHPVQAAPTLAGGDRQDMAGRLSVVVANETGALGNLSTVIGKNGGNITNLKITNRTSDFFEMLIDVDVHDVKHLTNIMAALRATPVIHSVERGR